MTADAKSMKEEGNTHFKAGKYEEALACYTKVSSIIFLIVHGDGFM